MALSTLLPLWEDLHINHNVNFLLTDQSRKMFSSIRGKGGHADNLTAEQFRHFLRQVMVDHYFLHSAWKQLS